MRRAAAIPLADAASLRGAARRTALERLVLAAVLVALVLAAAARARDANLGEARFVPAGSRGIVVLDVSASVSTETYERIGETLSELARSRVRYGLVVFSDVAYEALPPGTRATELRAFARYFTPSSGGGGSPFPPTFPPNPWQRAFSSGTKISFGLDLARRMIERERLERPAVLLISDLEDDPFDVPRLREVLLEYEHRRIALRIVGLDPDPEDERFFRRLLPTAAAAVPRPRTLDRARTDERAAFPTPLVAAALALALALAGNELWCARITWGDVARRPSGGDA